MILNRMAKLSSKDSHFSTDCQNKKFQKGEIPEAILASISACSFCAAYELNSNVVFYRVESRGYRSSIFDW